MSWRPFLIYLFALSGCFLFAFLLAATNDFFLIPLLFLSVPVSFLILLVKARRRAQEWKHKATITRVARKLTEPQKKLIAELQGTYTPYVIDAADQLGESRDSTATPILICVLEQWVDEQRPGWVEVAEAIARALAHIGDPRALPPLQRLETIRGIGILPAVRQAIADLEPQSLLLRPGETGRDQELLRPGRNSAHSEPTLLVRAVEPEARLLPISPTSVPPGA